MNLYHFAQNILESPHIEDKLRHPGKIDYSPLKENLSLKSAPERSDAYSFGKKDSKKLQLGELNSDRDRGLLLLMFMNHELVAIELMAHALIKFSNSVPEEFQRGLVQTLIDEQKHCRLYLNRLKELSCQAGDLPLSSFFWDCLSKVETPQAYLAGMSLTLEQANLDFTCYYKTLFTQAGDKKTADILKLVYEDEIRHVQFGVDWMNKWNKDSSFWDYYLRHLPTALDPSRAKSNKYFDMSGRLSAQMDEATILQFKLHNSSKGRSPNIWTFNPGAELESHKISPRKNNTIAEDDLCPLLISLCKKDDILLSNKKISLSTLERFYKLKFPLPENFDFQQIPQLLKKHKPGFIKAWGKSPVAEKKTTAITKLQSTSFKQTLWQEPWKNLYSKKFQAEIYRQLISENDFFDLKPASFFKTIESLLESNLSSDILLKAPLATTGRGCRRVSLKNLQNDDLNWINGNIKRQGGILAEAHRERLADFSAQYELLANGKLKFYGLTQIETQAFANTANICGPFHQHWSKELKKFVFANGGNCIKEGFDKVAQLWAKEMIEMDFSGPFALDGFIWKEFETLYFRPICELNPRITMGRIALELNRACQGSSISRLSIINKTESSLVSNTSQMNPQGKIKAADIILTPDAQQFFAHFKII
ncbi:DUF455 family protein [Lentisphaera profundi]|uniref:DUF455 family protein n=1 Tax=Lentisphaera profundi TaxID=1658616 RepID=A0ABY7VYD8_9BACT|nr:DUF455 family protein [Lentisphaera profundi]WDE97078.1 DUF455 family protein [Lentisphaera profundi]